MTAEVSADRLRALHCPVVVTEPGHRGRPFSYVACQACFWGNVSGTYPCPTIEGLGVAEQGADATLGRVQELVATWERDDEEHLSRFGQHLPASAICLAEQLRAVLDGKEVSEL